QQCVGGLVHRGILGVWLNAQSAGSLALLVVVGCLFGGVFFVVGLVFVIFVRLFVAFFAFFSLFLFFVVEVVAFFFNFLFRRIDGEAGDVARGDELVHALHGKPVD